MTDKPVGEQQGNVRVTALEDGTGCRVALEGVLNARTLPRIWETVTSGIEPHLGQRVILDGAAVSYCDTAGVGLLIAVRRRMAEKGGTADVEGWSEDTLSLIGLFEPERYKERYTPRFTVSRIPEDVGRGTVGVWKDFQTQIAFVGELVYWLGRSFARPGTVRWKDAFRTAETAGVDALPIVLLIGFLIGLIMAFQAAIPMSQFGAEIFVASLVSLSMLRELGPLMTAIVLAGRSGSAFAAEIGTMKVNEEVSALVTMGLEPVQFLAVPRVIAAVVMTPVLTVYANVAGLVGGLIVMLSMGFPFATYYNQVLQFTTLGDLVGGLAKAFVFGILVAGVGCMRGLQTGTGASAVGDSTTRSVVSSIVLIAITDGVFSVIYYALGI